ncbi:hypothetical protein ACFY1V_19870 [Streptomyces sp. NPDC001255]|uniref:hypothetical protein n=1 Tax=Streptomyces sp. NPDC001255 TaxID=3364550 RepID=UPI0036D00A43
MPSRNQSRSTAFPAAVSRRGLLQSAGAVGGLALAGGVLPGTTAPAAAAPAAAASAADPALVTAGVPSVFGAFNGVCQVPAGSLAQVPALAGIGWNRLDIPWQNLEPVQGQFDQSRLQALGEQILAARRAGVRVLPVLAYTARWAGRRDAYAFDSGGRHYAYGPVTAENDTHFTRHLKVTRLDDGRVVQDAETKINRTFTPPADRAAWLAYVERVVDFLSAEPYGVEYFQVWNEAYQGSSFWFGGMDEYFTDIHLPAAGAIRARGGKTVFGGWPCGLPLTLLTDLLDKHRAWGTLDVLDVHYDPLPAMEYLRTAAARRGHADIGVWQTEHGFVPDGTLIPNLYPKAFAWALGHGLARHPDRFKLFWFAWGSANDPKAYGYGRCLHNGTERTAHARTLAVLGDLLGGNRVTTYSRFRTEPQLPRALDEHASAAEGFTVGKRKVVAVHLARQGEANIFWDFTGDATAWHLSGFDPELRLTLQDVPRGAKVSRVDILGNRTELTWLREAHGSATVVVPVMDTDEETKKLTADAEVRTFYVVVDPA